jgi:hypothetical protein
MSELGFSGLLDGRIIGGGVDVLRWNPETIFA